MNGSIADVLKILPCPIIFFFPKCLEVELEDDGKRRGYQVAFAALSADSLRRFPRGTRGSLTITGTHVARRTYNGGSGYIES